MKTRIIRFWLLPALIGLLAGCANPSLSQVSPQLSGASSSKAISQSVAIQPADRSILRFESFNMPSYAMRHAYGRVRMDNNISPMEDSQWRIVPGLANSGAVSFESVNFPGQYLRHRNGEVWKEANDGGASYNADATWYQRTGQANSGMTSFESYNMPGSFIRHRDFLLYCEPTPDALGKADSTFRIWNFNFSWVKGAVFVPTNATNEVQQWDQYDPAINDRELQICSVYGINVVRVYLHYLVWEKDKNRLLANIEDFLSRATKYGIQTEIIFFDDCWNANPSIGSYPPPLFGVHNSRWVQCPGNYIKENYAAYKARLQSYVQDVVNAHKTDSRVLFWETYNEPGNSMNGLYMDITNQIMKDGREWIKSTGTDIPISSVGDFDNYNGTNTANATSDFFSFHNYGSDYAGPRGKNVLCTECMNRTAQSVPGVVSNFYGQGTGFIIWEAGNGRDNCRYPWGNTNVEPNVPFHTLFYPDGHPWAASDVQAFRGNDVSSAPIFNVSYYRDTNFTDLAKTSITPRIDFDLGNEFGTGSPDASAGIGTDNFSTRWWGTFSSGSAGSYTFYADGDNVVRVTVNGSLIVNKTGGGRTIVSGTIVLAANANYGIQVEYVHASGDSSLHIQYAGPGIEQQVLLGKRGSLSAPLTRFESSNIDGYFIRHQDSRARIDNAFSGSLFADSQWIIRPGLANSAGISLESANYPGQFLRHRNGKIWRDSNNGSAIFAADATWYKRSGLSDAAGFSFESYNFPGEFMRHANFLLYRQTISSALDRSDATFYQR